MSAALPNGWWRNTLPPAPCLLPGNPELWPSAGSASLWPAKDWQTCMPAHISDTHPYNSNQIDGLLIKLACLSDIFPGKAMSPRVQKLPEPCCRPFLPSPDRFPPLSAVLHPDRHGPRKSQAPHFLVLALQQFSGCVGSLLRIRLYQTFTLSTPPAIRAPAFVRRAYLQTASLPNKIQIYVSC